MYAELQDMIHGYQVIQLRNSLEKYPTLFIYSTGLW